MYTDQEDGQKGLELETKKIYADGGNQKGCDSW